MHEHPSALSAVVRTRPWRELPRWALLSAALIILLLSTLYVIVYLETRSLQWAVLLVFPTIAVAMVGGVVAGTVGGFVISLVPPVVALVTGHAPIHSLPLAVIGVFTFAGFSLVVGYVGALTMSFKRALAEVHTLRGILPVCTHCHRVRDDRGYWTSVEEYLADHSEIEFSHGFCDECVRELYPQFFKPGQRKA